MNISHTSTLTHTQTYAHTQTHPHTHTHARAHTHIYIIYIYIYIYMEFLQVSYVKCSTGKGSCYRRVKLFCCGYSRFGT